MKFLINIFFAALLVSCTSQNSNESSAGAGRDLPSEEISPDLELLSAHTALPNSVVISPGDNIQNIVNAHPTGTSFFLKAGLYRNQQIAPKTGNSFVGEKGAVLTGAVLLENFSIEGAHFVATGRNESGQTVGYCEAAYPRCTHPEELFFDDIPLRHVASLNDVIDDQTWFFDYVNHKVYFKRNPSGRRVELASTRVAFANNAADKVLIRGLTIEKYAIPAQMAAIGDQRGAGEKWQIEFNTIRWNHGAGVNLGPRGRAYRNKIYENGNRGVGLIEPHFLAFYETSNVMIEKNEIYRHCYYFGIDCGWDGGGIKITNGRNIIIRDNNVYKNNGRGIWSDVYCINIFYENNLVTDNIGPGIAHEISHRAVIRNNVVKRNGSGFYIWGWGAQILVQNSTDVEVYENNVVLSEKTDGISVLNSTDRGTGPYGEVNIRNVYVHHNDVHFLADPGTADDTDSTTGGYCDPNCANYSNGSVRLNFNRYHVPDRLKRYFSWQSAPLTFQEYKNLSHQEQDSVVDQIVVP